MEDLGLVAVIGLLLVKEAGLPVPVPGDSGRASPRRQAPSSRSARSC
ncbi:MAG: hypothetical protein HW391_772 [Chloroflexi bacterium]|nr:hypothetical protein [Chloroflexota bacterium]